MATKKKKAPVVKVLMVAVAALVELLEALGATKAGDWFKGNRWKKKLGEGLENIPALADAAGDKVEKLDEDDSSLLTSILSYLEEEKPIQVVLEDEEAGEEEDEDEEEDEEEEEVDEEEEEVDEEEEEVDDEEVEEEEDEEEAPKPKKGKKSAAPEKKSKVKKRPTAGDYVHIANKQEDDEWDGQLVSIDAKKGAEINDETPCTVKDAAGKEWYEPLSVLTKLAGKPKGFGEKAAKKGGAKKGQGIKKAEGKKPGVGVIGSIVEFLQKGSAKKPLTKADLLAKLCDRFPDRPEESMSATINVQVPNRINRERDGMEVKKNDKSPAGYWIEQE